MSFQRFLVPLVAVLCLFALTSTSDAWLIVHWNSTESLFRANASMPLFGQAVNFTTSTTSLLSVPLEFSGATPTSFKPINGMLVSSLHDTRNLNFTYIVVVNSAPVPAGFASVEDFISKHRMFTKSNPASGYVIIGGYYLPGGYQFVRDRGVDTSDFTIPIVQVTLYDAAAVDFIMSNFGDMINVTITDSPQNDWVPVRRGAGVITVSVLSAIWNAGALGLAIYMLYLRGVHQNLGTLVLCLEISASLIRFLWCLDPFADRFMPVPLIQVLLTMHLPMQFASSVFITSLWVELSSHSSVQIVGILTTTAVPTIFAVVAVFVVEIVTVSYRAARMIGLPLLYINTGMYFSIDALLCIYILYGTGKVLHFTVKNKFLKKGDTILRNFTIRVIFSVIGLIVTMTGHLMYVLGYGVTAVGDTGLEYAIVLGSTFVSSAQVFAMGVRRSGSSRSNSSKSGTNKKSSAEMLAAKTGSGTVSALSTVAHASDSSRVEEP